MAQNCTRKVVTIVCHAYFTTMKVMRVDGISWGELVEGRAVGRK